MKSILLRRSFITEAAVLLAAFVILSAFGAAPRAANGKEAWPLPTYSDLLFSEG